MSQRLDQLLVEKGLASSRTKAKDLIEAGQVIVKQSGVPQTNLKPATLVAESAEIAISPGSVDRYVSRGGLKLEGALRQISASVSGACVLDVGQSTGGFTDCVLQAGAAKVVGIDVGHNQLQARLKNDPRVQSLEGMNARSLDVNPALLMICQTLQFQWVVVDLSFISLTLVLPALARVAVSGTQLLALVKPQFEVGPEGLGNGGVVRDPLLYLEVERKIKSGANEAGWIVKAYFESSIEGKDGNKEFFIHAVRE